MSRQGTQYVSQVTNQLSSAEQERATISFWLVQLFYELKNAAAESRLSWVQKDVNSLNGMQIGEFHRLSLWKHYFEAIMTVAEYTQQLKNEKPFKTNGDNLGPQDYRLPPLPETAKPDWSAISLSFARGDEYNKRTLKT